MPTNTTITPELLDQLLANYEKPEDLTGADGLFKQLKKAMRNPHCEQMFSALLPTTDVIRQRRSSATSITARVVDHPAGGKAPRPQRSPRVVFLNSAFSSRR